MKTLRSIWRSVYVLLLLLAATVDGRLLSRPRWGAEGAVWIHCWCRRIVRAMGIEYTVEGALPVSGAVVSNHMSYLDIMVYSAIRPFVMVAKREVRTWPLLGWLTAQAGTVYVQRSEDIAQGARRQTHAEVDAKMAAAYASGLPVLFFPEGTTTDGKQILPFRRGLFHSILKGDVPLRVAALRIELSAENGAASVGEDVCFVGDALLAPHLFGLLGLRGIKTRVRFGAEVSTRSDRFTLAQGARREVIILAEELARAGASSQAPSGSMCRHEPEAGSFEAVSF